MAEFEVGQVVRAPANGFGEKGELYRIREILQTLGGDQMLLITTHTTSGEWVHLRPDECRIYVPPSPDKVRMTL